jgi:hypothetical protein
MLRSMGNARLEPGTTPRISDTRVLRVPAVTRRGNALSVVQDSAERPVHDRGTPASAIRRWLRVALIIVQ